MKKKICNPGFIFFLVLTTLMLKPVAGAGQKTPLHHQLESTFEWFRNHPPAADGSNDAARMEKSALLDEYGMQLSHEFWKAYRAVWATDPAGAREIEKDHPVLYYFRYAADQSAQEIRNTPVTEGVVIWKLYNMGYVVKTRDACFAIDLVQPGAGDLSDVLDFAIVSHAHGDHYDTNFLNAMVAAGKKVYSPFFAGGTVIDTETEFRQNELKVRFTMNDQSGVPVIVTEVNCGPSAQEYTIYHIADSRVLEALNPTRKPDLLILHIANGIDIFETIKRTQPAVTVFDHVMELGHAVGKYRWSYDYTYDQIRDFPKGSGYVLTWGERLQAGVGNAD